MWLSWRPSPMICCLQPEIQESQWCNLVPVQRPENQRSQWYKSGSESKGWSIVGKADGVVPIQDWRPKNQSAFVWGQEKMGVPVPTKLQILPFSTFLFSLVSQQVGWCPPAFLKVIFFNQSTPLNANLLQNHPQRNSQKQCFTSCLASL